MRKLIEEYGEFIIALLGMLPIFIISTYIYSDSFREVVNSFIKTITCSQG